MEVIEPVLDSATVARLRQLAESVARPGEDLIGRLVDIFVTDSRNEEDTVVLASSSTIARPARA